MTWSCFVPGVPIPQARARSVTRGGRTWQYYEPAVKEYRDKLILSFKRVKPKQQITGPCVMALQVYLPRAWSRPGSLRAPRITPSRQRPYPDAPGTGDWSNFTKMVEDALQTAGVLDNDSRIVGPDTTKASGKYWAGADGAKGIYVALTTIGE